MAHVWKVCRQSLLPCQKLPLYSRERLILRVSRLLGCDLAVVCTLRRLGNFRSQKLFESRVPAGLEKNVSDFAFVE